MLWTKKLKWFILVIVQVISITNLETSFRNIYLAMNTTTDFTKIRQLENTSFKQKKGQLENTRIVLIPHPPKTHKNYVDACGYDRKVLTNKYHASKLLLNLPILIPIKI